MSTASTPEIARPEAGVPAIPETWRVRSRRRETQDTMTLTLESPQHDHRRSPASHRFTYAPGQFNMLYVFGAGEVPISISGDPGEQATLVHTIRNVGPVTQAMTGLRAGDAIGLRGPYGTSWPVEAARGQDVVIIAGGIGLAPLRPAIYHILAHREEYGRVALLYGARTPRDILYPQQLARWRGRVDVDLEISVDAAPASWRGNVGLVTTLLPRLRIDPAHAVAMICGPEIMMRFTAIELEGIGFPLAAIYLSLERNMKCGVGHCGHCQLGPFFACKDGPVLAYDRVAWLMAMREV
jgi:NAD(P)H-flavin reductase